MFQEVLPTEKDFTTIGRTMPRERHQDGWVEKTGKKTKKWTGHWHPYVTDEGGANDVH